MAKRIILVEPDPMLYKHCRTVDFFDGRLHTLIDDMKETLIEADGVGLAAPQVAVLKRVAIVLTEDGYYELINPILKSSKHEEEEALEGCLSIPKKYGYVTRPLSIVVKAHDRYGKLKTHRVKGFTARVFLHEMDHLDGVLYTSKSIPAEVEEIKN